MSDESGSVEIVVCLGSSCFARGNSENLAIINKHLQSLGLNASVRLTGKLCQDQPLERAFQEQTVEPGFRDFEAKLIIQRLCGRGHQSLRLA